MDTDEHGIQAKQTMSAKTSQTKTINTNQHIKSKETDDADVMDQILLPMKCNVSFRVFAH